MQKENELKQTVGKICIHSILVVHELEGMIIFCKYI